jgi:polyisoprenoid-binding protein YceI
MRTLLATVLLGLFVALPAAAKPVTYHLDPNHTQVRVVWTHFGFSHPAANFTHVTGTLVYDAEHPTRSSVKVNIPMAGLDTHVAALDEHLKGADFFDIAKYPQAHFVSTDVRKAGKDRLTVDGKLSVHGITRPVTLHVTVNKIGMQPMLKVPAAGFDATATLKRSDFGVGAYAPMVSDTVHLEITVEADAKH